MSARIRISSLLTLGYALFIVYASLSPFSGWREQGIAFQEVLELPWRITYTPFDALLNFASYIPFGLLLGFRLRLNWPNLATIVLVTLLGGLLSASMEYLQMYLPSRTSSNVDLLTNVLGTAIGCVLAVSLSTWTNSYQRLLAWRYHCFNDHAPTDFGLGLLCLWMFGQSNPALPMLGNLFVNDVADQPFVATVSLPFHPLASLIVLLNLLLLGSLLLTLLPNPRHLIVSLLAVLCSVALCKFAIAAVLLKSSALLLWINAESVVGIALGLLLLRLALFMPPRWLLRIGMLLGLGYFVLLNFDLFSPHHNSGTSVYQWRIGHLRNYNGLAQTIAEIFPLLLLVHLWRARPFFTPNRSQT